MENRPSRVADYPFLRTRRKPVEARKPETAPVPHVRREKPVVTFLRPVRHKMDEGLPKLSTPVFHGNTEMSLKHPVIRFDNRQSAIGSLVVKDAQAFAWEDEKLLSGIQVYGGTGNSKVDPPVYGNRPLVGWDGHDVVLNLLHGQYLRRLVVASAKNDLFVTLYDGSEIFAPMDNGNHALVIYRVGHEFEMRLEKIDTMDLMGAFGMIPSQVSR